MTMKVGQARTTTIVSYFSTFKNAMNYLISCVSWVFFRAKFRRAVEKTANLFS